MSEQTPIVDGVVIGWDEARAANLANWEDRVPIHVGSYGIDALADDPARISHVVAIDAPVLLAELGRADLHGLTLCHLQCHIGTDTVSLARLGATVTGVDFSPSALEQARALAARIGVDAHWVCTDVLDAKAAVDADAATDATFDVVYTSIGTIGWLADLETWARQVEALLAPGGVFFIRDGHPMLYAIDEATMPPQVAFRYFPDGTALQMDEQGTYLGDGPVAHTRTYEWPHPLSEVVTVLLKAGLQIARLEEGRTLPWRFSDHMIERADGDFEFPAPYDKVIPCTFTLVARKPAA